MAEERERWVRARDGKGQRVTCLGCKKAMLLDGCLADTHGPAFKAYYHKACAPADARGAA